MAESSPANPNQADPQAQPNLPEFSEKIETALREGGRQIRFDDIEKRYRGKRVWVLDREKMERGVMRVVDEAIRQSHQADESNVRTRERVSAAIATLFGNTRNLTSPVDASKLRQRPATTTATPPPPPPPPIEAPAAAGPAPPTSAAMEQQITRLATVIDKAEKMITRLSTLSLRGGGESRPIGRWSPPTRQSTEQNKVLVEIFQKNIELRKGLSTAEG